MANDTIMLTKVIAEDLDIGVSRVEVPAPSGGYVVGNQINLSSFGILNQSSWTPGTIAVGASSAVSITVPGAAPGFPVLGSLSIGTPVGLILTCQVVSANTVYASLTNTLTNPVVVSATLINVIVFPIPGV